MSKTTRGENPAPKAEPTGKQPLTHCPRCGIGRLKPTSRAFSAMLGGMLLSVPHVPAGECDVCGYAEFDEAALIHIGLVTGDLGIAADAAGRAAKRLSIERDADAGSSQRPKS